MGSTTATAAIEGLFCPPPDVADPTKKTPTQAEVEYWVTRRARDEARSLFRFVGEEGQTVRSIRDEIYIPPDAAREMFRFIESQPDEGCWILAAIEFRNRVLREFDLLAKRTEYAERIGEAEAEAARRAAAEVPLRPLLHDLVVAVSA